MRASAPVVFERFYLGCLAHASYLIADPEAGEAAVIDPQRDVDQYVTAAHAAGCRITRVFLTHFHADFLAGHLELREREGAVIHLGARAEAEFAFAPLGHGASVHVGAVRLEVLETPGHSPESISILVHDPAHAGDGPWAVLTGDTLFIGDVGRPDLRASLGWAARDLAGLLHDSLHRVLLSLPDATLVYPAHGAGSLCGKALGDEAVSTIGIQRAANYALQPMDRDAFVDLVLADQPDTPAYFTYDAVLNSREHPTLDEALGRELRPLAPAEALRRGALGRARLLDTREPADFAAAHVPGSLNIGLGGSFATWCGTLLEPGAPIILIADPGREREAAMRLGRIGFDSVAGYLDGGMGALADGTVDAVPRVTVAALAELRASPDAPLVVDVRARDEWDAGHIDGALSLPLAHLQADVARLPVGRPLVLHCATDYRSIIAASLLRRAGVRDVSVLVGGIGAWQATELPTVAA